MFTERTSVGLDVHARSVAAAAIDGVTGELSRPADPVARAHPVRGSRICRVRWRWPTRPARPGSACTRRLTAAGIRCEVVAPSKLQSPAGDRVKTDAKDAVHLARLLRLDEITAVAVPTVEQEAARDLVRPGRTAAVT